MELSRREEEGVQESVARLFLDECEKRKKSGSARSALGVGGQRVICGRGAYLWKKRSCFFPSKTKRGKTQKHQERELGLVLNPKKCTVWGEDMNYIRETIRGNDFSKDFIFSCIASEDCDPNTVQYGGGVGSLVHGCPIGDELFIKDFLAKKLVKIGAKINKHKLVLQNRSAQGLQCFNAYCFSTYCHYLCQVLPPRILESFLKDFDSLILQVTKTATELDFENCSEFAKKRFRQPKKLKGAGIREMNTLVCRTAFVGNIMDILPELVDIQKTTGSGEDANTVTISGFMPSLAPLIGEGSFDLGPDVSAENRFRTFVQSANPIANAFADAYKWLQSQVSEPGNNAPPSGPLQPNVESAASTSDFQDGTKPQHLLTSCIERFRHEELQKEAKVLLTDDKHNRAAIAFTQVDRFSTQPINSIPYPAQEMGNTDYSTCWATYFGLPHPENGSSFPLSIWKNASTVWHRHFSCSNFLSNETSVLSSRTT